MSASAAHAQNPPVAASSTATPANNSSSGSSANVAAGSAQPTARSSYANATKKISSPTIASSGAPAAVGAPQSAQHGKSSSASPVNGSGITPAVPAMPTIVSGGPNGDHSRKSSVHIKQTPPTSGAPSNIKFGSLAGSPAPAPAMPVAQGSNLNPQAQNPRVASPAHSPSPIPTPVSGGPKPDGLPTRPNLVFGGQGSESADGVSVPHDWHSPSETNFPSSVLTILSSPAPLCLLNPTAPHTCVASHRSQAIKASNPTAVAAVVSSPSNPTTSRLSPTALFPTSLWVVVACPRPSPPKVCRTRLTATSALALRWHLLRCTSSSTSLTHRDNPSTQDNNTHSRFVTLLILPTFQVQSPAKRSAFRLRLGLSDHSLLRSSSVR